MRSVVVLATQEASGSDFSELLVFDGEVKTAIVKEKSSSEIKDDAVLGGMRTLRDDGIYKAFKGLTTFEEVLSQTAD